MIYSIDTCSLVEPWRRNFPPDVIPSLWEEHLPNLIHAGDLRATQEVRVELERQDDELLAWVQDYEDDLFVEVDEPVQVGVAEILSSHPSLVSVNSWRSGADPFVIALARTEGCTVVTEENPRSQINPKIPDVCQSYGTRCIRLLDLIRDQGWIFR